MKQEQIQAIMGAPVETMTEVESESDKVSDEQIEQELTKNVANLLSLFDTDPELSQVLVSKHHSRSIKQETFSKLQSIKMRAESNERFDGSLKNLLLIAQESPALTEAIELYPKEIYDAFSNIKNRYALVSESPRNHASLIHFDWGLDMPEIRKQIDDYSTGLSFWKKSLSPKKAKEKLSTHRFNESSLLTDIDEQCIADRYCKVFLNSELIFVKERYSSEKNVIYFNSYGSFIQKSIIEYIDEWNAFFGEG